MSLDAIVGQNRVAVIASHGVQHPVASSVGEPSVADGRFSASLPDRIIALSRPHLQGLCHPHVAEAKQREWRLDRRDCSLTVGGTAPLGLSAYRHALTIACSSATPIHIATVSEWRSRRPGRSLTVAVRFLHTHSPSPASGDARRIGGVVDTTVPSGTVLSRPHLSRCFAVPGYGPAAR